MNNKDLNSLMNIEHLEKVLKRNMVRLTGYDNKAKEITRLLRSYNFEEHFEVLIKTEDATKDRGKCEHNIQWSFAAYTEGSGDDKKYDFELQASWERQDKDGKVDVSDIYLFDCMTNEQKVEYGPFLDAFTDKLIAHLENIKA